MLAHSVDKRVAIFAVGALHILVASLALCLVGRIVPSALAASGNTAEKLGRELALAPIVGVGYGDGAAAIARCAVGAAQADWAGRERRHKMRVMNKRAIIIIPHFV